MFVQPMAKPPGSPQTTAAAAVRIAWTRAPPSAAPAPSGKERTVSDRSAAISPLAFSLQPAPRVAQHPAARTRLLLEGPPFSTLLRLAMPNVLNLLALAGMITFDGLFVARL